MFCVEDKILCIVPAGNTNPAALELLRPEVPDAAGPVRQRFPVCSCRAKYYRLSGLQPLKSRSACVPMNWHASLIVATLDPDMSPSWLSLCFCRYVPEHCRSCASSLWLVEWSRSQDHNANISSCCKYYRYSSCVCANPFAFKSNAVRMLQPRWAWYLHTDGQLILASVSQWYKQEHFSTYNDGIVSRLVKAMPPTSQFAAKVTSAFQSCYDPPSQSHHSATLLESLSCQHMVDTLVADLFRVCLVGGCAWHT